MPPRVSQLVEPIGLAPKPELPMLPPKELDPDPGPHSKLCDPQRSQDKAHRLRKCPRGLGGGSNKPESLGTTSANGKT